MYTACVSLVVLSYAGLFMGRVTSQNIESFRIPSGGDSCNVVNLNFGRGEEHSETARGPQGPPGKRGSTGLQGLKGDKGSKGEVGPRGITPEVNVADVTSAAIKALSATTCEELINLHGITQPGDYLMKSNETARPVYKYCNFEVRQGITTCQQLREALADDMKSGYYLMKENDNDQPRFLHCSKDSPQDCKAVNHANAIVRNSRGGVFDIVPESADESVRVYCDLVTDGGGWTVFQRRMDGSVDFYRDWDDYVNGFGEKDKEFWLGLETIHQLTRNGNYELRIDLADWNGDTAYAKYGSFSVGSRDNNYRLNVGTYSGTAGDSLAYHTNMEFSTNDADNDPYSSNCAETYKGAWWYNSCHYSDLNVPYKQVRFWHHWKNSSNRLRFSEMKFRKKE